MHEYETNHAWNALTQNQNRRATRGDGVLEGCQVTAGDSSEDVESEIDGGYVRIDGDVLQVAPTATSHEDGDPDDPRRDVVAIERVGDYTADVVVIEGDPAPWAELDGEEFRHAEAWEPWPDDTAGSDLVALAVVSVEPGATQSSGIDDVEDRRREPAPTERQPWQQPNITTPPVGLDDPPFFAKPLTLPGDSWLHVWSVSQMRFDDGQRADWPTHGDWELSIMEPVDGDPDEAVETTTAEWEFDDGDPVWQIPVGGDPDELRPYWLRLENTGNEMGVDEYWAAQLAVTVDRRPLG